jgi:mannose-6-phosphate isomerase-like protein (cupin superfamily)
MSSRIGFVISPEVFMMTQKPPEYIPVSYGPVRMVEKVWGVEYWLENNDEYCGKILAVNAGFTSSLHYHKKKNETFLVLSGLCRLVFDDVTFGLNAGARITIPAGVRHRFYVKKSDARGCKILELSTHHDDKDVVRLEESRALNYGE